MSDKKIRTMVTAAVLAALSCVATMVVQIPSPMNGYVNLGDCFVLLSGWLLGPWYGAAAAGIGSMLVDLLSGYGHYVPGTLIIKGIDALVAALIFRALGRGKTAMLVSGIVGGDTSVSAVGLLLGVGAGFCYATYTIFAHYGMAHYSSYTMIYWTFLVAGLGSIFFADFKTLPLAFSGTQGIVGTCGVVIVATVLPYIFYTKGLEGVESGRASIITNIEPVVETLVGVFVFKEALTVWTVLGVACVFGCVILLAREGGKTAVKE